MNLQKDINKVYNLVIEEIGNLGVERIKIEEIQESIKLINSDSTAIIPRLKEVSTIKVTGINKEIILKNYTKNNNKWYNQYFRRNIQIVWVIELFVCMKYCKRQ